MTSCPLCGVVLASRASMGGHFNAQHATVNLPVGPGVIGDWVERAACKGQTTLMYADEDKAPVKVAVAKRVCDGCPVSPQCLRWALKARERHGVWGGMTPRERDTLLRRRAVGAL